MRGRCGVPAVRERALPSFSLAEVRLTYDKRTLGFLFRQFFIPCLVPLQQLSGGGKHILVRRRLELVRLAEFQDHIPGALFFKTTTEPY